MRSGGGAITRGSAIAAVLAATLGMTACGTTGAASHQGGSLSMALYASPTSLNPLVAGDINSVRAYTPLFPHLYSVTSDLRVVPDLATALPSVSADGLTWTISLRRATWSDKHPITASDVVYTITTEKDPTLDTHAVFDWSEVAAVKALDAQRVQLTLRAPDASFLADHLTGAVVPAHALSDSRPDAMSQSTFGQNPSVTGGPFQFGPQSPNCAYTYSANPSYYGGRANFDTICVEVMSDPDGLVPSLANGFVLWAPGLTASQADDARQQLGVRVDPYPALGIYTLQPNVRSGHVFSDPAVRHALDLAIDRAAVTDAATSGRGTVMWGDITPGSWAYDATAERAHARDVTAARQVLAADGWTVAGSGPATKGGAALHADLLYPRDDPARARAVTVLAREALAAGIVLTPTPLGPTDFASDLVLGSFDIALSAEGLGVDPDDSPLLACGGVPSAANPNGLNDGGYCSPAMDALLQTERQAAPSPSAMPGRRAVFAQVERLLASDAPVIPLWTDTRYVAINTSIGGTGTLGPEADEDLASAFYASWYLGQGQ